MGIKGEIFIKESMEKTILYILFLQIVAKYLEDLLQLSGKQKMLLLMIVMHLYFLLIIKVNTGTKMVVKRHYFLVCLVDLVLEMILLFLKMVIT